MIDYGMFLMPVHNPAKPPGQCYDEDMELLVRSEELGFSEFWIGEHHSSSYENIVMPEIFIGKALGLTSRMRLGAAPVCLPYHHPAHVAGRLAFLDHLSHGRLNICFGPGAIPTDLEMFGIRSEDSGAMVGEAIQMIMTLWTTDPPYDISGRFWQVHVGREVREDLGIGVYLKPLQKPHPPLSVPVIMRDSSGTRIAGQKGFSPFSHHMVAANVLANHWETYASGARSAGKEPDRRKWKISRNIFVAESTKEAREMARNNALGKCLEYIMKLTDLGPGRAFWKRDLDMPDSECTLDYMMDEQVIAGDPDECVRQLHRMMEETGEFGTFIMTAHDWDDREAWINSLELFAREVMPKFNRSLGYA